MEESRFVFSVSVGLSLLLIGTAIALKASIGIALILLGIILIVLAFFTRNQWVEDDKKPELLLIPVHTDQGLTR